MSACDIIFQKRHFGGLLVAPRATRCRSKSCDDGYYWTSPPMLLGESTPLNKERGEQRSEGREFWIKGVSLRSSWQPNPG